MNAYHVRRRSQSLPRCKAIVAGIAAAAAWLFSLATAPPSNASVTIYTGTSAVTLDPNSSAGVENWTVNSQNQIHQEWFWFRIGSTGGQSSIDTIGTPSITLYDTTGDGQNDTAQLVYGTSNSLQITVTYSLSGGSESPDLGATIEILNGGTSSEILHFFEYANFNLGDLTTGQKVTIAPGPGGDTATDVGNGWQEQTSVSPASEYEANDYPSLYDSISSSTTPCTLSDASPSSTGDGEWGFEWDTT
ncbi:MAG: hypothetical protein ABSC42_11065, partial [Tepidisphaeraceae bacterium]